MKKVFIIIPAYNEEESIENVLKQLQTLYPKFQIVVVIDGARDQTASITRKFRDVIVLEHRLNRGQGAALETGNEYARQHGADIVIHFDADGQFDPHDIPKMIEPILQGDAEIVLGSRFLGTHNASWLRELVLRGGIIFQWILTGLLLTDAHNGFRVFSKKALDGIQISQDGMAHATEIIEEIARLSLSLKEVPVSVRYFHFLQSRTHAQRSIQGSFRILNDIFKKRMVK